MHLYRSWMIGSRYAWVFRAVCWTLVKSRAAILDSRQYTHPKLRAADLRPEEGREKVQDDGTHDNVDGEADVDGVIFLVPTCSR